MRETAGASGGERKAAEPPRRRISIPQTSYAHDAPLVLLSVLVAFVGAYAALDLAGQVALASGRARSLWLAAAALALGVGVWATHFVGMLALEFPFPVAWDPPVVLVSLAVSVAGSGAGLAAVCRRLPLAGAAGLAGGLFLGLAFVGVYFVGLAAMRFAAAQSYAPLPTAFSVGAAVVLSGAGLWLALRPGGRGLLSGEVSRRGGGALLLAAAIVGMHYLAVAGTHFVAVGERGAGAARAAPAPSDGAWGWAVGGGALLAVLALALLATAYGRRLSACIAEARSVTESQERFRSLARGAPDFTSILEADGTVRYVTPSVELVLGYAPEERTGRSALDLVHPDDAEDARRALEGGVAEGVSAWHVAHRYRRKDGSWRHLETVATNLLPDPIVRGVVVTSLDITERKEAERRRREAETRYRTLVERLPAIVYVRDADEPGATTYVSPRVEEILGYPPERFTGDPGWRVEILHPDDRERVLAEDERTNETGEPFASEYRMISRDGGVVWFSDEAVLVRDEEGRPLYWLGVQTDVADRKAYEERLEHQALHDGLTGLPNRALFLDRLEHALARKGRIRNEGGGKEEVAVLFLDLDDFKVINDSLGHDAGDGLLVAAAERFRGCLRPEDTAARLGGDEFAFLLGEVADEAEAARVAERIGEALGEPFRLGAHEEAHVTASVGVALVRPGDCGAEDLLRHADVAMYRAKAGGKARHKLFEPAMGARAAERLGAENRLRGAIARGELVVHYQPMFSVKGGAVVGMEALARWADPERGLVPPAGFVTLAEETGLIAPIGEAVMREACLRAAEWRRAGGPGARPVSVWVNLSPRQFHRADVVGQISAVLEETGLEARCLGLEITEGVVMDDAESTIETLGRLRSLGVRLAIDDFGKGFSSLNYVKRFPVDSLKLDRSFVGGICERPEDLAIARAVITLGHSLGMGVVAEGVETAQQLVLLRGLGCDLAQGYHLARPMPSGEASAFLAEHGYPRR